MSEYYIGLMSGTSMDGIDAALVEFGQNKPPCKHEMTHHLIASCEWSWPKDLQNALIESKKLSDDEVKQLAELDIAVGEQFALAALHCLELAHINADQVIAIGSHGQTVRHRPDIKQPFSLQIGDAQTIANTTQINVVSDFRTADINAGGEGAPLAPGFHRAVFKHPTHNRVIVNIGGISNITRLPANNENKVIGFDVGPGNNLMDAWIKKHKDQPYDNHGHWAAQGKVNDQLLKQLLDDPYIKQAPPKSTGFEYFNPDWLAQFELIKLLDAVDIQATLCEYTALTIAHAIKQYASDTHEVFVCGGGAFNTHLMKRLQSLLDHMRVESTDVEGIPPDLVEAMAFAWLARQHVKQLPGNIATVTGATQDVILGKFNTVKN